MILEWCLQEQLRAEKLLAEEKHLTFRPSINHYDHTSRPRLRLSNPGPYLAYVQAKALKRRESLLHMKADAEVWLSVFSDQIEHVQICWKWLASHLKFHCLRQHTNHCC